MPVPGDLPHRDRSHPEVTDGEIASIYAQIRDDALGGELDAALVLLRVAEIQRTPEE